MEDIEKRIQEEAEALIEKDAEKVNEMYNLKN